MTLQEAFKQLKSDLLGKVLNITWNAQDAEEVMQDAEFEIYKMNDKQVDNPLGYVNGIVKLIALNKQRKAKIATVQLTPVMEKKLPAPNLETAPYSVDLACLTKQEAKVINAILTRNISYSDYAKERRVCASTCKHQYRSAIAKLKEVYAAS